MSTATVFPLDAVNVNGNAAAAADTFCAVCTTAGVEGDADLVFFLFFLFMIGDEGSSMLLSSLEVTSTTFCFLCILCFTFFVFSFVLDCPELTCHHHNRNLIPHLESRLKEILMVCQSLHLHPSHFHHLNTICFLNLP